MSPEAESVKTAPSRSGKLGGKNFEETFKPNKAIARDLEEPKGKKKKKKSKGLVIFLVIIVLLAGSGAALYFTGFLNDALAMLGLSKPSEGFTISELQAALDEKTTELEAAVKEINALQAELEAQQAQLDSVAAAAPSANPSFETILAGFSEEKLTELKQIGTIYSKMDPAAAAAIMLGIYDSTQIAVIVYYMQPAASALLLEQLDPALAGDVTLIMTS